MSNAVTKLTFCGITHNLTHNDQLARTKMMSRATGFNKIFKIKFPKMEVTLSSLSHTLIEQTVGVWAVNKVLLFTPLVILKTLFHD